MEFAETTRLILFSKKCQKRAGANPPRPYNYPIGKRRKVSIDPLSIRLAIPKKGQTGPVYAKHRIKTVDKKNIPFLLNLGKITLSSGSIHVRIRYCQPFMVYAPSAVPADTAPTAGIAAGRVVR